MRAVQLKLPANMHGVGKPARKYECGTTKAQHLTLVHALINKYCVRARVWAESHYGQRKIHVWDFIINAFLLQIS